MTFTVDNNNDNNNDTNSAEEFEIDVDAIYTMASLAREWFVAHESGTEALTILKEAKEELSSMLKKKKEKKDKKKNENEDFSSSPYHVKVQEKIKSILPSDDMLNCLMKRGKYANFSSAADAERVDEACEKLRRIVEELESISKQMEETFESFTSAFENGGKEVQEVKEEAKIPPEHLARRDEEKEEGHGRQGRDREPRGRRRSRSRSSRGRDRRRGKETEQKEDEAEEAVVLAKRLSFLETTKKEETDDEAPSPKVHWMHNVPNAALSTRFSLSNTTAEINNNNNNNKRSFEQWLFLCASALEGTRKELRVKQVVAEKALDSLRGSFSSSNTNTSNSTRSTTEDKEEKEDNNGVLLFDSLLDAWDVQAFVDDDAFRALSSESVE